MASIRNVEPTEPTSAFTTEQGATRVSDGEGPRILAVDDDEHYLEEVATLLRRAGYDVLEATCGAEALEVLASRRVDCILMDVLMPGLSGAETCRRIRSSPALRSIPIIMLTALDERQSMIEGFNAGADDYVSKLARFDVVQARLKAQLRRKRFEEENRQLEDQLRQAQKMEAVGRLAGGVAHDFNNLLTAIFSFGQFVLDELKEGSQAHDDMQQVLAAAHKAESLTAQLLAFSRRKPVSPQTIDINLRVEDMDKMLRRVVGEDVALSTTLQPDPWSVRIDPGSLEQVIINLAVNARDAMPHGGKLCIETANVDLGEQYGANHGAVVPAGQYVRLSISDDGLGMDTETKAQIFEPFFSTKEPGQGTGLGLSMCYGIIKQAGGFIWVYSEPGQGTAFKIYLPRVAKQPEPAIERVVPVSVRGHETVLVTEDDEQVRGLAVRTLRRLGYDVLSASSATEAIITCKEMTGPLDLLLTDVVMPGVSGTELVETLTPSRPDLKVIYMSGYTAQMIEDRGILNARTQLLEKPFTPDALARKVRQVLDDDA